MIATDATTEGRGRSATSPGEINLQGWRDILLRTKTQLGRDNVSLVAAGVAFYAFLSLFPALAAILFVYGLVFDPAQIEQQIDQLVRFIPVEAAEILRDRLRQVSTQTDSLLGAGLFASALLALWSANKGMKALMTALNIIYNEEESRGFFKLNSIALLLTTGAVVFFVLALTLIAGVPTFMGKFGSPDWLVYTVNLGRWPVLALLLAIALGVLYRFGPSRSSARWRWLSIGSVVSLVLWLGVSLLFSVYVAQFGNYDKTYGSLGAVVVLLFWLYFTSIAILIGAELNGETEHQTRRDTTTGKEQPIGERGAYVADTVGKVP